MMCNMEGGGRSYCSNESMESYHYILFQLFFSLQLVLWFFEVQTYQTAMNTKLKEAMNTVIHVHRLNLIWQ